MAKLIFRDAAMFSEWHPLDYGKDLTVEEMHQRMVDPEGDQGFVGHMMEALMNDQDTHIVEVWDSDFVSYKSGVLVIRVSWTYFHAREYAKATELRIMEGEV